MAKLTASAIGLILLGLLLLTNPTTASAESVKWSTVNIPTEGKAGNWQLASGSSVQHPKMTPDGTLYAYGQGLSYTLYKSTDTGYRWSYTGKVKDDIIDIAILSTYDSDIVYYATASQVYKLVDKGYFAPLPTPGGAGSNNIEITSIDVTSLTHNVIVASTRDTDNGQYGGIYLLDEADIATWIDTGLGNYDAYTVAFSPNYPGDRQLVAAVSDETDTLITTDFAGTGWGATIADARISNIVPVSAEFAFPDDYDPSITASYFVAIDSGINQGDVYRLDNSTVTDLNAGLLHGLSSIDVTGLAVSGNAQTANLMAGAAASAQVYLSRDSGRNWERSLKPPTGQSKTYVLISPDFAFDGRAYAATSGSESAFSYTTDGGTTWNQTGLIDTTVSDIVDLAPSPHYSEDNTVFMLTSGSSVDSLWCSLNSGKDWERVLSSTPADIDSIDGVKLPRQYDDDKQVVFISGSSNSNSAMWKSKDNGQLFARRVFQFSLDTWVLASDTALFLGSFDVANNTGLIYYSANSGLTHSDGTIVGSQSLNSIALSPNYDEDKSLLVGNSDGWAYWSEDNGMSFEELPPDATSKPLDGNIIVAFDPDYSENSTVYAASGTADAGIYRFITGKSDSWENIDSPAAGKISELIASSDGTLYAANLTADGGMERCLNPTYPLGPTFETVTRGLDSGVTLSGLWQRANQLWAADSANTRLITFTDTLAQAVTLDSPGDRAAAIGTIINYAIKDADIDWETLEGATEYRWQLDYDTDFSSVPSGFEGDSRASTAHLPALDPTTTYYWRVRATEPILSRWSDKWSFTTSFGTEANAPHLDSPAPAATGVPVNPIFQWGAVAGADSYEFIISTKTTLNNPTILKSGDYALTTTAWQCNSGLDFNTTYYWKVRAVSADSYSPWSSVSAFTTEDAPSAEGTVASSPIFDFDWENWLMPLGGLFLLLFLLIMIMMLIIMIVLLAKVSKL